MVDQWSFAYVLTETIPNWIMAIAAAGAAVVFVWRKRDKAEQEALRVEELGERIDAHWVTTPDPDDENRSMWGILVTNGFGSSISNVEIDCNGNRHSTKLQAKTLAPGRHFFRSATQAQPWGWAMTVPDTSAVEPVGGSAAYRIDQITFTTRGNRYVRYSDGSVEPAHPG